MKPKSTKSVRHIQSCIVSVSFPETLDGVLNMVKGNKSVAKWATDLDMLLNFRLEDEVFWTAPKWLTQGDLIFFYQTKRAKIRTAKLLADAREKFPRKRSLINLLERAKENADLYAGSIFACASVAGATRLFEKQEKHFVSRLFAPLKEVYVLGHPLRQEAFNDYVKIGLSTITPIYEREFNGIKKLLEERDDVPPFLQDAALGDKTFKNANVGNWRSVSCQPDTKFIHEAQLRSYLIDFFLGEIKDIGTPLLEECECFRDKAKTGRADYFIKVGGRWIPVEAKLDISREKNLLIQAGKYMNISSFSPAKGTYRNQRLEVSSIPLCLILDQAGIYFISRKGRFIKSGIGKPRWKREKFTEDVASKIREEIKKSFS